MKKKYQNVTAWRHGWWQRLFKTMKLTFMLILVSTMLVSAGVYSQNTTLSLNYKNIGIGDLLQLIEKQTEFRFAYSRSSLDPNEKVTIEVKNENLEQVLETILDKNQLTYKIFDRYIVISDKNSDRENSNMQQSSKISGRVTDSSGSLLPGVTVVVKGTTQGTITDAQGNYSLANVPPDAVLVFSFVGMRTQEVAVAGKKDMNVTMEEEAIGIEEIVAIGYGTMKKSDLTGSVGQVDAREIQKSGGAVLQQALAGKVAGARMTQTSGSPGADLRVRIRGSNSIYYGNDPLYVIDGVLVSDGSLSYINPNDVESVSILKDASSTAIYGARGANGVIVITTKSGREGKTEVGFEAYAGIQQVTKELNLLNAKEWATLARTFWSLYRGGALVSRAFSEEEISEMGEGTNWQDAIFRLSPIRNYDVNIKGGNSKTKFFVSANYFDQEGIVINSRFQKGTLRVNLDHTISDKFSFGMHLTPSYVVNNPIANDVIYQALIQNPVLPVKNEDGTYSSQKKIWQTRGIYMTPIHQNPVQMAYERQNKVTRSRILSDIFVNYAILNDLKLKVSFGAYLDNRTSASFTPSYFESSITSGSNGSAGYGQTNQINWLHESVLTYVKKINKHVFDAMLGFSAQSDKTEAFTTSTWDFLNNSTGYYNLAAGADPQIPSSSTTRSSIASFLGRINYNFNQRYLLTVSGRYDGSSRFGKNNKFGFFPSAALAWRISSEPFFENLKDISNLKLRVSAGRTGNQSIPLYQNVQTFATGGLALFGDQTYVSIVPGALVNDDLRWEKTDQYDVGLDFGLWDNKLNFQLDYYYKKTNDLLLSVQVPRQGGYSTALKNIGSVENQGFEFGTSAVMDLGKLNWSLFGNVSFNKNKVLKLSGSNKYFGSSVNSNLVAPVNKNGGAASVIMEGQPLGAFWGNIFDGLWQTQEEYESGHMKNEKNTGPGFENYRDISGNGIFEEGVDETVVGDPNPDFEFSLTNDFTYGNFDFSFYIYGMQGNDVLNINLIEGTTQVNAQNGFALYKQAWTGPGTSNLIPKVDRPNTRSGTYSNRVSTNFIEDGSFIRLQNVSLGYSLKNLKFCSKARFYIAGENLFVLTGYSGYDPEVNSLGNDNTVLGVDNGCYPKARTVRLGVQFNF